MLFEAQPFLNGLLQNKLMMQRCQICSKLVYYPRHLCPHDLGELKYEEVSTTGTILTYSIIHRCAEPTLQDKLPYIGAIIELDEGIQFFGRLVDIEIPLKEHLFNKQVQGHYEMQGDSPIIVFKLL